MWARPVLESLGAIEAFAGRWGTRIGLLGRRSGLLKKMTWWVTLLAGQAPTHLCHKA